MSGIVEDKVARFKRSLCEAATVDFTSRCDGLIELRLADESGTLLAYAEIDFQQAGAIVDTLNKARTELVLARGHAQRGHA